MITWLLLKLYQLIIRLLLPGVEGNINLHNRLLKDPDSVRDNSV